MTTNKSIPIKDNIVNNDLQISIAAEVVKGLRNYVPQKQSGQIRRRAYE